MNKILYLIKNGYGNQTPENNFYHLTSSSISVTNSGRENHSRFWFVNDNKEIITVLSTELEFRVSCLYQIRAMLLDYSEIVKQKKNCSNFLFIPCYFC